MEKVRDYIPNTILEKLELKEKEEILIETKKKYLEQIQGRSKGESFLRLYTSSDNVKISKEIEKLARESNLSEIYYLIANFFTCTRNHQILFCEGYDIDFVRDYLVKNVNENGMPIWRKGILRKPTLWNIFPEDKDKHYYITYIHSNPESKFFDPIIQEFYSYRPAGLISFRIHLDHSLIIEVFSNNHSNKDKITNCLDEFLSVLNIKNAKYKEINDKEIRIFDKAAEQITHETREGEKATASLTRTSSDKDTREDEIREELNERDFRNEHGVISNKGIKCIIGLKRGKKGSIQIMRALPPSQQIKIIHKLFEILGWI